MHDKRQFYHSGNSKGLWNSVLEMQDKDHIYLLHHTSNAATSYLSDEAVTLNCEDLSEGRAMYFRPISYTHFSSS